MQIETISDLRKAFRHGPYAWPGGYPCFFLMADGEALSFKAAKAERRQLIEALANYRTNRHENSGWRPCALTINYEDADLVCCHTGTVIESAYGEAPEDREARVAQHCEADEPNR